MNTKNLIRTLSLVPLLFLAGCASRSYNGDFREVIIVRPVYYAPAPVAYYAAPPFHYPHHHHHFHCR